MNIERDRILGRIFAIGAAMAYGVVAVLIRKGVGDLTPPLVGAAIALLSGTVFTGITGAKGLGSDIMQRRRSVGFLLASGVAAGLGILASFFALSMSNVVIVSPLQSTNPLFSLLLSYLFLRQLEKITFRVVIGTLFVIAGVALITCFRV